MAEYREDLIFRPKTPPKKRKDGEDVDTFTLVGERTELVKDEDTRDYFLAKVRNSTKCEDNCDGYEVVVVW